MPDKTFPRPLSKWVIRKQYVDGLILWVTSLFSKKNLTFTFEEGRFPYFRHRYNLTWLNERTVEIPLAYHAVSQFPAKRVLEIGHVLSHYFTGLEHSVVDKYEKSSDPRVLQSDAHDFKSDNTYDLIISLSTLEHVGWDETPLDLEKVIATIRHLERLLAPGGAFIFTVPAGYHPTLLQDLLSNKVERLHLFALQRISANNMWKQASASAHTRTKFGAPYPFANAIILGVVGNPEQVSWSTKSPA